MDAQEQASSSFNVAAILNLAKFAFADVGSLQPKCPHCAQELPKMPRARCKCPACKSVIRLKHRNTDRQLVIISDADEARLLEEGLYKDTIRDIGPESASIYDSIFARLQRDKGRHPFHLEVIWGTLVALERSARERGDHGIARNHRYRLSVTQIRAGKEEAALRIVCQCCYLDICGPKNSIGPEEAAFAPWSRVGRNWQQVVRNSFADHQNETDSGPFADGLLGDIDEYRKSLKVSMEELQKCAEFEAIDLVGYTRGVVTPELFATELIRELRSFTRRTS